MAVNPGTLELKLANGYSVFVYAKDSHQPATFTILNFEVDDVEEAVRDLKNRGIEFEQYTGELQTDAQGIFRHNGMAIAWFMDPAGNILSVLEPR